MLPSVPWAETVNDDSLTIETTPYVPLYPEVTTPAISTVHPACKPWSTSVDTVEQKKVFESMGV